MPIKKSTKKVPKSNGKSVHWFDAMTPLQQRMYLRAHPGSKFASRQKGAANKKNLVKPASENQSKIDTLVKKANVLWDKADASKSKADREKFANQAERVENQISALEKKAK